MGTFNSDADRLAALRSWLQNVLDSTALGIAPASEDASFRRYFRVRRGSESFICMDAPVEYENTRPFVHVAGLLGRAGVCVPDVLAADTQQGFLLLKDLGSRTYLEAIEGGEPPGPLYEDAIATLATMHSTVDAAELGVYDEQRLRNEMGLFEQWFTGPLLGLEMSAAQADLLDKVKAALVEQAIVSAQGFVHRDYHSRNLMVCRGDNPGVLDFQDAVRGPMVYDLVSLLRDSYVRWPPAQVDEWIDTYLRHAAERQIDTGPQAAFRRGFDLVGAQRHIKVCGIFSRLYLRDGKAAYLKDIPLTLEHLQNALRPYPEFAAFCLFLRNKVAPAMTAALHRLAAVGMAAR